MTESESQSFQRSPGNGQIKLSSTAIQLMKTYAQLQPQQSEAGGILLGRFITETEDVIVDEVTVPKMSDWRHRTGFRRSNKPHQRILNDLWYTSEGTCNYLGEWHTHPEPSPSPSGRDLKSWKEQLNKSSQVSDALFFVIVGTQQITVWEAMHSPFSYKQLKKI